MAEGHDTGHIAQEQTARRIIEGEERIPLLADAEFIAIAPGIEDEPPDVIIRWAPDAVERTYPGTAIWRAALARYLATPAPDDATSRIVRPLVSAALVRFRSLEMWLRWANHERTRREHGDTPSEASPISGPGWPW